MAHVFLSHSRLDRTLATSVVHAIESYGLVVWWDWKIDGGENWRRTIHERLRSCGTIVVLWTPNSVMSDAVIEEASVGARRDVLVPLYMQPCEIPYGFGEINYVPLCDWNGKRHDPEFQKAVASIQRRSHGLTPLLTMDQRTEITTERRSRAFKIYEFPLREEVVNVFVGDPKDDEAISRARARSHLSTIDNAEYLRVVLDSYFATKTLDELLDDQNSTTPFTPVSSLNELAQAVVDRAVPSYRSQFNVD